MSNPGSPGGGGIKDPADPGLVPSSAGSVSGQRRDSTFDNGSIKETEGITSNNGSGNRTHFVTDLNPFVLLNPLEISDGQLLHQSISSKKKTSMAGILAKPGKSITATTTGGGSATDLTGIKLEMLLSENHSAGLVNPHLDMVGEETMVMPMPITPSIVKPRRPSVHFAVDAEQKAKVATTGGISERSRQDGGGSRKHRSRKEKLVCRSESPSDLGLEGNENRKSVGTAPALSGITPIASTSSSIPLNVSVLPCTSVGKDSTVNDRLAHHSAMKINAPTVHAHQQRGKHTSAAATTNKVKSRVKRTSSGSAAPRTGARKNSPNFNSSSSIGNLREPVVKKKKVIEIVSPRKRKMDHLDIVKTSSDPIFVRAANKPFKFKTKSQHGRLKFSRVNIHKSSSSSSHSGVRHQIRRSSSSANPQTGSGASLTKQRLFISSPLKKEPEAEPPCFPPSLLSDLLWVMEDAEKEFSVERSNTKSVAASTSNSHFSSHRGQTVSSDLLISAGESSAAKRLAFGRRRVESEPPGTVGFEMPPTPGSPSGSQTFYHVRKEVYFSPSPSYAAPCPTGRRRYSRRRHAKIHPPFDDTNCLFQAHHCPNSKIPGSQYCEKHLDQGPTSGYSHCKYLKDGRQCGNLFPSFDSTMTFCEHHANQIAKAEYELRNPKIQPDATKNLLAKINKMFTEGLSKTEVDNLDTSSSNADILQIIDEPDIIHDLPLANYSGGLLEELDAEADRNVNPDKPDYDALKNAGYFTTEEIIQIHVNKLRKLKTLYHREKELEWLTRQHKLKFFKEGLEKLKSFGPRFTTNPYLISRNLDLPKEYIDHQLKQYGAAKAILQTAYKADGEKGLLRLKMLQKTQELARMAKARGQKQHDTVDICDSETDVDSDSGDSRDRMDSSRYTGNKSIKCAYNEGYAIRACQNPPVCWSNFCFKHILSDPRQVQWVPCNRHIGPDPLDTCKTPCLRTLEKHGCAVHAPLVMSKHKPLRRSEEELNLLADSDNEEEEVALEGESLVLANLVSDECTSVPHLDETISKLGAIGPFEITDTSDSEETDEEVGGANIMAQDDDEDYDGDEVTLHEQIPS